jgi:hypothetical protein
MPQPLECAAPVVRRAAGLQEDLGGRALGEEAAERAARDRRWRSSTRPGTVDTATSKTDLARSTPICILGMGLLLRLVALWGRFVALARWCRWGEESIPSQTG